LADLFTLFRVTRKKSFQNLSVSYNEELVKGTAKNTRTQLLFAQKNGNMKLGVKL
jgi:hypothetical protein